MNKAYQDYTWHDRPSTLSPVDALNLNAISHALSLVDDRVINVYETLQSSVANITVDETTGLLTVRETNGRTYSYNSATRIYSAISANQQAVQRSFQQVELNLDNVHDMLDAMDVRIDLTAEGANAGITNLQTTIQQLDGYYRQEMTGIQENVDALAASTADDMDAVYNTITSFRSSITQTTNAIQLSVEQTTQAVSDLGDTLNGIGEFAVGVGDKIAKTVNDVFANKSADKEAAEESPKTEEAEIKVTEVENTAAEEVKEEVKEETTEEKTEDGTTEE